MSPDIPRRRFWEEEVENVSEAVAEIPVGQRRAALIEQTRAEGVSIMAEGLDGPEPRVIARKETTVRK